MMIIDAHAHWYRSDIIWPEDFWPTVITTVQQFLTGGKVYSEEELKEILWDEEGKKLIREMDGAGIEKTILHPVDFGVYFHKEPILDFWEMNKLYSDLAKSYPDRIYTYFGIDPRREKAAVYFSKAIEKWGNIKGLKIYPPCGFYPNDPCCDDLYRICEELDLPVLSHGGESAYSPIQYCRPEFFRSVLEKFPRLRLIYAHAGWTTMFKETVDLLKDYENVYTDISTWQAFSTQQIADQLEYIEKETGSLNKIMFGTDAPNFNAMVSTKEWVDCIQSLELPGDVKEKIFSGTAIKVHRL